MKRVAATMAVLLALVLGMGLQSAGAAIPQVIAYQGLLTDSTGNPLNGTYRLDVKIYTGATGGSPLWAETHANVTVTKGVFSVMLGSVNPFSTAPALTFDSQYHLGVTIDNGGTELTPRVQLASVASAFNADKLDGLHAASFAAANHTHSPGKQMFTTSGTFTVPTGVTSVYVTGVGGGGGGSCSPTSWRTPYGGGGGASIIAKQVTVTPGNAITVTIGAGGAGGKMSAGGAGGASSFGTYLSIPGGGGAYSGNGAGGSAPAGGAPGQSGSNINGGGTAFGSGGPPGGTGGGFGGGGGPAISTSNEYGNLETTSGGPGRPGFILVEW